MSDCVPPDTLGIPAVSEAYFSILAAVEDRIGSHGGEGPNAFFELEIESVGIVASVYEADEGFIGSGDVVFVEGGNLKDLLFADDGGGGLFFHAVVEEQTPLAGIGYSITNPQDIH